MGETRCQCDPELKKVWGCESPAQAAVWIDDEDTEYYNCPMLFITDDILNWFEEYIYYQEYPGAIDRFEKQSNKYLEAMRIYKQYYNTYLEQVTPKNKDGYAMAKQMLKGTKNG